VSKKTGAAIIKVIDAVILANRKLKGATKEEINSIINALTNNKSANNISFVDGNGNTITITYP
jgi:hypothetical protein